MNRIARWDGSSWHPVGSEGGNGLRHGAGSLVSEVQALQVHNGSLYAGGLFAHANAHGPDEVSVRHLARWDGQRWHAAGGSAQFGLHGMVHALSSFGGRMVAGGTFAAATSDGGDVVPLGGVGELRGNTWIPIQGGTDGVAFSILHEGRYGLHIGGLFGEAGGTASANIASRPTKVVFGSGFEE
jgi:hypothetical protein